MVRSIASLNDLYLPSSTAGKQVPLSAIATFEERTAPLRLGTTVKAVTVTLA